MANQPLGNSSTTQSTPSPVVRHEGRGFWVLTAYGISGLALFGVLVYYFSNYVTR